MMTIIDQTGKAVRGFMVVMRDQPLSLALVVMNFVLLGFLFYNGKVMLEQRTANVELVVAWQREADRLMVQCVSAEVVNTVIEALSEMKKRLPPPNSPPPEKGDQ